MTWYPIAFMPPQYEDGSGAPYSGAVLKAYEPGTSNPLAMATDNTGATTSASFVLNASGYPTYSGNIIIPYLQENYDLALYPSQAAADANSGAIWTVPNIPIAEDTNEPFAEYFDGGTDTFALSEDLGNDARVLLVFADKPLPNYVTGGDFSTPPDWTAGANWSIASGTATATTASSDLSQNAAFPFLQGHSYTITYTITRSAGDITPKIGGTSGTTRSSAGTYTETIIAGSTQVIAFTGNGFTGTVDNVSVKPTYAAKRELVRPDEMTLTGNQLVLNFVPPSGTKAVAVFAPSLAIGAANNAAAAAATSETNCANSEAAVQALRDEIFSSDFVLYGTSVTSLTIGTGAKVFTTQAGKQWVLGQRLRAASDDGTMLMEGEVTDYTGTAMTLDVDYTEGAGTHADWNIGVTGAPGEPGPSNYTAPTTTVAANIILEEATNNGAHTMTLKAQDALAADVVVTGPSASGIMLTDTDVKFKRGSFTYNVATASGTQNITGVGFQPDWVEFYGVIGGTSASCHGDSDGSSHGVIYSQGGGSTNRTLSTTQCLAFLTSGSDLAAATCAMAADGFNLSWTKTNSPTGTASIFYRAGKI